MGGYWLTGIRPINGIDDMTMIAVPHGGGSDTIMASFSSIELDGGEGNDSLYLEDGIDHITDFDTAGGDVIELNGMGIHDYDSFLAASHDTAGGVFVSFNGDTSGILIEGITLANLSSNDVIFT